MTKNNLPEFNKVSPNEFVFEYKGNKFMLVENDRGVFGIGKAIQLYQLNGLLKTHIKEVGWTKSDNHNCSGKDKALITEFTNIEECKFAAVKYIDDLLK